jgi:hypothetical protein
VTDEALGSGGMWFKRKGSAAAQPDVQVTVDEFLGDGGARELRDRLTARDWTRARTLLADAPTTEHFARRLVTAADTAGLEAWIDGPIRDEPSSTLPVLIKGARHVYWAWEARGSGRANTVPKDVWDVWFERLRRAEDCLDEVVDREPGNAEAWHWLIVLGRARQVSKEERWRRYAGLVAADPTNFYGHTQMLEGLMAKWSGSAAEMFDFARRTAKDHPGTHLPVLVVHAHLEHRWNVDDDDYLERPDVGDEIVAAAHASLWHPSYQPSLFTTQLLNTFAYVLSLADRYVEAERCFADLGDHRIYPRPWDEDDDGVAKAFVKWRRYVIESLEHQRRNVQSTH